MRIQGFKLGIVVFIIGILIIMAIPRFIDITNDTKIVATQKVAEALSAANTLNYHLRKINASQGRSITNCTDVKYLLDAGLPGGFSIEPADIAAETVYVCVLQGPHSTTATFGATGIR